VKRMDAQSGPTVASSRSDSGARHRPMPGEIDLAAATEEAEANTTGEEQAGRKADLELFRHRLLLA